MKANFIAQPNPTAQSLQDQIVLFASQFGVIVGGKFLANVAVGTTSTTVPHSMGSIPTAVFPSIPSVGTSVQYSAASDASNLYLQASAPCTVSLWVI